jgi:hypothetical protein
VSRYYGVATVLDPAQPLRISQSDLSAFKRDRRIWFLKTYLALRPKYERPIGPLVLGTLTHAALEKMYVDGVDPVLAFALEAEAAKEKYLESGVGGEYFPMDKWDKQCEQGRLMLEGYVEWLDETHADSEIETVAVEKHLEVDAVYLGMPVKLIGKADHIVRDRVTGETLVLDWKTTNNLERMTRQAHTTEQLPYYMTLEAATGDPHPVNGAAFTILLKTMRSARAKPPFYRREPVRYGPEPLARRQAAIHGVITDYVRVVQALHTGVPEPLTHAYPNPGVLQFDSEFEKLIDVIDTGGNVAGMIRDHYQQADPYARYAVPESSFLTDE